MDIQKIPSELIEPHLTSFLGNIIEAIATDYISPEIAKQMLRGVEWFVSNSAGIRSKLATNNLFFKIISIDDDELLTICKNSYASIS